MWGFQIPSMMCRSVRQTPAPPMRTITSVAFSILGSATSSIFTQLSAVICSSYLCSTCAFIFFILSLGKCFLSWLSIYAIHIIMSASLLSKIFTSLPILLPAEDRNACHRLITTPFLDLHHRLRSCACQRLIPERVCDYLTPDAKRTNAGGHSWHLVRHGSAAVKGPLRKFSRRGDYVFSAINKGRSPYAPPRGILIVKFFKKFLFSAAFGAAPVIGQIFKRSVRRDIAFVVSHCGIIDVFGTRAFIAGHLLISRILPQAMQFSFPGRLASNGYSKILHNRRLVESKG